MSEVTGNPNQRIIGCIDLFAGAGGFSLAAKQSGLTVNLAVENDRHACSTYRYNLCSDLTKTPLLIESDIQSLNPTKLAQELAAEGRYCDLLLGGPPCQGFSTHRINNAGVNDPRNSLIHTYFKFVEAFRPRVFLMENVPGMLWKRHSDYLAEFYKKGKQTGYDVYEPVVLDARNFGIPQRRKRVFIIGVQTEIDTSSFIWPPSATHCDPKKTTDNSMLSPWKSCKSVFRAAPTKDPNNTHMNHSPELKAAFKKTPANGGSRMDSGRLLPCHRNHDGHKDVYGRIDPSHPAPTMTTACINPSKGRFVHPTQHHGITLRQAARIQTFPDSFIFQGGLIAAGRQIGNAVPVDLATSLISHIKEDLIYKLSPQHFPAVGASV